MKLLDRKNIVFVLLICSMFALFAIDVPDISQVKSFESLKFTGVHEQGAEEMRKLDGLSRIITDSMNEMSAGAIQINNAVQEVNEITRKNKESIDSLSAEFGKFKV